MKNTVGVLLTSLLCSGLSTTSAFAGWKSVKLPLAPTAEDSKALRDAEADWKVTGNAHLASIGSAVDGNASIDLEDQGYQGSVLTKTISTIADQQYSRAWFHVPTQALPVGDVEYKGKAYAHYKAAKNGEAASAAIVSTSIIAKVDGKVSIANAYLFGTSDATSEDEKEDSAAVDKCPAKNFSLTHVAGAMVSAAAMVGNSSTTPPQHLGGGNASIEVDGSNTDEALSLISLLACP